LNVKCVERCRYGWPDSYDAVFCAWSKQSYPKIAAKEQLGAAPGRRASGTGCAVVLHLFDSRGCMIRGALLPQRMTFFHLPVTTRASAMLDVDF
jgi:hypothetical protein